MRASEPGKNLPRELATERARKHKLDSKDKLMMHLNQCEATALRRNLHDMEATRRNMFHGLDQDRKHFVLWRRKSMGNSLLLENQGGQMINSQGRRQCTRSDLMRVLATEAKRKASLESSEDLPLDMKTLLKKQESLNSSLVDVSPREKAKFAELECSTASPEKHGVSLNTFSSLPEICVTVSQDDGSRLEGKEYMDSRYSELNDQPRSHCPSRASNIYCGELPDLGEDENEEYLQMRSSRAGVLRALSECGLGQHSHSLFPATEEVRRNSDGMFRLPYMLALDDEEISQFETEQKKTQLRRQLRRQSHKNERTQQNVKSWIEQWENAHKEELKASLSPGSGCSTPSLYNEIQN